METLKRKITLFVHDKLIEPTKRLTRHEVLVAVLIGILSGVFPIPLTATLVALMLASYLQFTAPQFALGTGVNFLCTPLQFLFIPLLARACAVLTRHNAAEFTVTALRSSLNRGGFATIKSCGLMLLHALVMWCICAIPVVIVCRTLQERIRNDKSI